MQSLKKKIPDRPRNAIELAEMLEAIPREGLPLSYPSGIGKRPAVAGPTTLDAIQTPPPPAAKTE
jgi:hypothetical protein